MYVSNIVAKVHFSIARYKKMTLNRKVTYIQFSVFQRQNISESLNLKDVLIIPIQNNILFNLKARRLRRSKLCRILT